MTYPITARLKLTSGERCDAFLAPFRAVFFYYHKIVIALTETLGLMAEIAEVIETHGGWPGAFAGTTKS